MQTSYDYVIVGAGPTGIVTAYCLAQNPNNRILLIDKKDRLGGCHSVTRHNNNNNNAHPHSASLKQGFFRSHSPTLFSTSFVNLDMILKKMKSSFADLFVPYKGNVSNLAQTSCLSVRETWTVMSSLFYLWVVDADFGKNQSCLEFCRQHQFSQQSTDWVDSINLVTDGASSQRTTTYQFLQLFNQQMLYELSEPKFANDRGLIRVFQEALEACSNIDIQLSSTIHFPNNHEDVSMYSQSFTLNTPQSTAVNMSFTKCLVLCIPPRSLLEFIDQHNPLFRNAFGPYHEFKEWCDTHKYKNDLSISYHFKEKLTIPFNWGLPYQTDWGVVFIVVSDYMQDVDDFRVTKCQTVINSAVTKNDTISSFTGKTVNQSTPEEMKLEAYRQLKQIIPYLHDDAPSLPDTYDYAFTHPEMYRSSDDTEWLSGDTSFVDTPGYEHVPQQSPLIPHLYTVGTHNGLATYNYTTIETAIQNALQFVYTQEPQLRDQFPLQTIITLGTLLTIIFSLFMTGVLLVVAYFVSTYYNNTNDSSRTSIFTSHRTTKQHQKTYKIKQLS